MTKRVGSNLTHDNTAFTTTLTVISVARKKARAALTGNTTKTADNHHIMYAIT